ncbi:MAG: NAD(+)/NADH kinase [Elusimicrobiota bacterium]|nr:NAD(+)/NADH kinase [Elusimicrobiota bacterium]
MSSPPSGREIGSVLVFFNEARPESRLTARKATAYLRRRKVKVWLTGNRPPAGALDAAGMALAIGGDGTMLRVARMAAPRGLPLLGVHAGGLGFLAGCDARGLLPALREALAGRLKTQERSLLTVEVYRGPRRLFGPTLVLNECVIRTGDQARAVTLSLRTDGTAVADYFGDGLIVATPTGSTAYALAASGPIVDPSLEVNLVVPICPHALTQRPLIVPATMPLVIRHEPRSFHEAPPVHVSLDGRRGRELLVGDEVRVRPGGTLRLLMGADRSFYDALRRKLSWGVR